MKIETSEAVRRFNAQTELADLVLNGAPFIDTAGPYEIMVRLRQAGHTGLADSFRNAGQALGYFPEVCPKSEPLNHKESLGLVILEREEMRIALKQCRKALSAALCGTPSEHYFAHVKEIFKTTDHKTIEDNLAANTKEIKRLAEAALNCIHLIIPASEV